MDLDKKKYIHQSWKKYNLKNIFIYYESAIEKLNSINVNYEPTMETSILHFLTQDITDVKILYVRYDYINSHFTRNEEAIFDTYYKSNQIMSIAYNLTTITNEKVSINDNIWNNLIKEVLRLLAGQLIFINIEHNSDFSKSKYKNISPKNVMIYNFDIKNRHILDLYANIIKFYEFGKLKNLI